MKHFTIYFLCVFIFTPCIVFSQQTDINRLLKEAHSNIYQHPEKADKLYNLILKNKLQPELKTDIYIQKFEISQLIGEYQKAVDLDIKLQNLIKETSPDSLKFKYWLQKIDFLTKLKLVNERQEALKNIKSIFPHLSDQYKKHNRINYKIVLLKNSHKTDKQELIKAYSEGIGKKNFQTHRNWYLYQLSLLYPKKNKDSALYFLDQISLSKKLPLHQIIKTQKEILNEKSIDSIFKNSSENLFYENEIKQDILGKAIENWTVKKDLDSLAKYNRLLKNYKTKVQLDKRKAKVKLLEHIYFDKIEVQKQQDLKTTYWYRFGIILLIIIILSISVFIYIKRRNKKEIKNTDTEIKSKAISEKTELEILKKIDDFEKSKLYLNPKMRIALMAKHLNTNTRYLSAVINSSKNRTFNNYINSLRINYIIEKLETDSKYLSYKISYLAEESGFVSQSSFTTAFKDETNLTPSAYIKKIKHS